MTETIKHKIERFIRTRQGDFDELALELFAYQFERNAVYRTFSDTVGKTPKVVKTWAEIPALPIQTFKMADVVTFIPQRAAAVFYSSATTGVIPSKHFLADLSFYEASLKSEFDRHVLSDGAKLQFLILTPAPGEAPRSSLTWMMDVLKRKSGLPESDYFVKRGLIEDQRLTSALRKAEKENRPVALLGTTLALLSFFELCQKEKITFKLASGSRLMDTGGMKKDSRVVSREAFLQLAAEILSIPPTSCFNEYGMCELSSQFYAQGISPILQGPPWIRVQTMDISTGEAKVGTAGLLRYFDLANVDSAFAIQTEDLGIVEKDGFRFLGRAPEAELRGCSLIAPTVR